MTITVDEAYDLARPLGGGGFKYSDAQGGITHAFALRVIEHYELRRAAADDLYNALFEMVHYEGGASDALHDEYVVGRAVAALEKARGE